MYLESENTKFIRLQPSKKGKAHFFFAFLKNYCLSVFYSLFYSLFLGLPTRFARVGPLRSSQVCSALRRIAPWSAAFGGPAPAPQPARRRKAVFIAALFMF